MEDKLPKRKHPRLKDFNYDISGAYFITICVQDRKNLLSHVGRGLAPAEEDHVVLTSFGKIVEEELLSLKTRFSCITTDQYVIMPNHIHVILFYDENAAGASPRPTIMDVVCVFKSLATKRCKKILPIKKLFQTSFYDRIIRDREEYDKNANILTQIPPNGRRMNSIQNKVRRTI